MPQLLKINDKAILHMTQTAELMEEMVDEKNREYEEIIDSLSVFDKKNPVLNRDELKKYPGAQQAALLHFWLRENMASARDVSRKHIESLVRVLSGGEQAKVRLCKLINRETNILLLDEPTNHLDVDAKAELKRALMEYKGSVLMVCHEPEFYDGLVTDVWDCSKWTTKLI